MDGGISSDYLHRTVGSVYETDASAKVQQKNEEQQKSAQEASVKTLQDDVVTISAQGQQLSAQATAEDEKNRPQQTLNTTKENGQDRAVQSLEMPQTEAEEEESLQTAALKEDDEQIRSTLTSTTATDGEESVQVVNAEGTRQSGATSESAQSTVKSAYQSVEDSVNNNSQATEHEIDEVA